MPVGLNPIRRGAALARDVTMRTASWCWLIRRRQRSSSIDHIDVDSPQWAAEVAAYKDAPVIAYDADPDDLFMLIFTSGTSGDPKAVSCSQGKVAIAGAMMTDGSGSDPTTSAMCRCRCSIRMR